jgi:hypothetical protein
MAQVDNCPVALEVLTAVTMNKLSLSSGMWRRVAQYKFAHVFMEHSACCMLFTVYLLGLFLNPDDGGSVLLQTSVNSTGIHFSTSQMNCLLSGLQTVSCNAPVRRDLKSSKEGSHHVDGHIAFRTQGTSLLKWEGIQLLCTWQVYWLPPVDSSPPPPHPLPLLDYLWL